ncbi:DUF1194 domain-containing protein [Neptunicella sp.]|uniref:DUF1194 domain-containing protein n=1 Tax=Neptunicella sp. TaxID=2125986 RepID=UPI003F68E221
MKKFIKRTLIPLILGLSFSTTSNATIVELSLLVDASGSISNSDFSLQIDAYENIFASSTFFDDHLNAGDSLLVNMILFGAKVAEKVSWHTITDNASAAAFSAAVGLVNRTGFSTGATWTGSGLQAALIAIMSNGVDGDRQIVDISTDGNPNPNSEQSLALNQASLANSNGIVVNAIGVGNGIGTTFLNNLTTAGGGFFVTANSFADFEANLASKLRREIKGEPVPEPSALVLLGLGLLLMARFRKAKQN